MTRPLPFYGFGTDLEPKPRWFGNFLGFQFLRGPRCPRSNSGQRLAAGQGFVSHPSIGREMPNERTHCGLEENCWNANMDSYRTYLFFGHLWQLLLSHMSDVVTARVDLIITCHKLDHLHCVAFTFCKFPWDFPKPSRISPSTAAPSEVRLKDFEDFECGCDMNFRSSVNSLLFRLVFQARTPWIILTPKGMQVGSTAGSIKLRALKFQ